MNTLSGSAARQGLLRRLVASAESGQPGEIYAQRRSSGHT